MRFVSFLFLANFAQGYTKFSPNCSIPTSNINFVQSPNARGTLDILWSCLFTIFACTWTVLHLNVPEQRDDLHRNWKNDFMWKLKGFWGNLKWMLVMVMVPEYLLGKTCGEWAWVRSDHRRLVKLAEEDGVPWSRTHTYFANMGGFVIKTKKTRTETVVGDDLPNNFQTSQPLGEDTARKLQTPENVVAHLPTTQQETVDFVEQKEKSIPTTPSITSNSHQAEEQPIQLTFVGTHVHLISELIIGLREKGILTTLPCITIDEINDRSKSDAFVRVIAIFQIVSMVAQILTRYAKGLAVSQLEIAVIAFAVCAIIIYILNWNKPQAVKVPVPVLNYDTIPEDVAKVFVEYQHTTEDAFVSSFAPGYTLTGSVNNSWLPEAKSNSPEMIGLIIGSIAFGGVHVFAWSFTFPTMVEQIAWRVTSVFSTCAMVGFWVVVLVAVILTSAFESQTLPHRWVEALDNLGIGMTAVIALLYILARIFMIIEMFRCLLYLPPSAYISTWAANIPQIS